MAKSHKVAPKRKPGRPATGRDPVVSGRVPPEVIKEMDAWASDVGGTRSTAIAHLLKAGVDSPIGRYPREIIALARRRGGETANLNEAKRVNERYIAASHRAHVGDDARVQSDAQ